MRSGSPLANLGACVGIVLAALGCFGGAPPTPITSPSGDYAAYGVPSGPEAGDQKFCVVIHVTDRAGHEFAYQTDASDNMKWALAWSGGERLALYSSDVGISAYDVRDGAVTIRVATGVDAEAARSAYTLKYGQPPPH